MTMLNYLKKLHDECVDNAAALNFNKAFDKDGIVVCLYVTMIEHTGSFLTLAEKRQKAGMSLIFRSFLEAYVDFVNLDNNSEYINHSYATYHKKWIRVLKESAKGNAYLKSIGEYAGRDDRLKFHENELQRLANSNFAPLKVNQRFSAAGMEAEYNSIYSFESSEAHNDLSALIKRHLERNEVDFAVVMYEQCNEADFYLHLDSISGLLLSATKRLHTRLRVDPSDWLNGMSDQLAATRANA